MLNSDALYDLKKNFGKDLNKISMQKISFFHKIIISCFLIFFLFTSFLADNLWECKKLNFYSHRSLVQMFTNTGLDLSLPFNRGHGEDSANSLAYMLCVELFSLIIKNRIICIRVISLSASSIALIFLYKLASLLFCPNIGLLYLFLIITSPFYSEAMRSFGFIPLTNCVVAIVCYLFVHNFIKVSYSRMLLLTFSCLLMLSLYVVGRLVIILLILFFIFYIRKKWKNLLIFLTFFISMILILDYTFANSKFNFKNFFTIGGEWYDQAYGINIENKIRNRLPNNIKTAGEILIPKDLNFHIVKESILNKAYLPFFYLGVLICLFIRNNSNFFLLSWFIIFFGSPLFSASFSYQRIFCAFSPYFLISSLGIWFVFSLSSNIILSLFKKLYFSCSIILEKIIRVFTFVILVIFLSVTVLNNVYNFLYYNSKPEHNYTDFELKQIFDLIISQGEEIDAINYEGGCKELILGNPYFVNSKEFIIYGKKITNYDGETMNDQLGKVFNPASSMLYIYNSITCDDSISNQNIHVPICDEIWKLKEIYADRITFYHLSDSSIDYFLMKAGI